MEISYSSLSKHWASWNNVGLVYILLSFVKFSYSFVVPLRMMAVSQRYNWRDITQFTLPINYYVNFLALQKRHVKLQMTIHKRASYLTLTPDQRACVKKLEQVILDSRYSHQLVVVESAAGTGLAIIFIVLQSKKTCKNN